ncbi:MAG: hypothetical protein ACOYMZ_02680 [Minisyncoccia bacterium]
MAIDGTKIIDSDFAHDIYNEFMELYDTGTPIETIKEKIEQSRNEAIGDEEIEIFITTYALALWETGFLTESILSEVRDIIQKGAGVKMWNEEAGEKEAHTRKRNLEKLLTKISTPKSQIRKRKKYTTVKNFIFQIDDALTFKGDNDFYYACILINIIQHKGRCTYYLTPTTYKSLKKPAISDLKKCEIIGKKVPSSGSYNFDESMKVMQEQGIEAYDKWVTSHAKQLDITLSVLGVDHVDLLHFVDRFKLVGKLPIDSKHKTVGLYGGALDFDRFIEDYQNQEEKIKVFKSEKFPISKLVKKRFLGLFSQ